MNFKVGDLTCHNFFTLSTDVDNSTQWQDDERQHNQQSNQIAVKNSSAITIKIPLVVSEQDHGTNPPKEKIAAENDKSRIDGRYHPCVVGRQVA